MKRLFIVLALAALLASVGLSHMTAAPPEGKKILVCHIAEIDYEIDPDTEEPVNPVVTSANVIEVSANSESAHLGHGDVVVSEDSYEKGDDCTGADGLDAQAKLDSEMDETE